MSSRVAVLLAALSAAAVAAPPAAGSAQTTDRVAVGAFLPNGAANPSMVTAYAREVGRRPAILDYYRTWDEQPFDAGTLNTVARGGTVPMITWEPWNHSLRDIARGRYDDYIRSAARAAVAWGRPVIVRFAHEMNGTWYPWSEGVAGNRASEYVAAWRRVVGIFRAERASNVKWMWAPNVDDQLGNPPARRLYPGDAYVDWVGLSGFSWGGKWDWRSPYQVFNFSYQQLLRISARPVAIAETGASEVGGDKAAWIRELFGPDLARMSRVRVVIWFNGRKDWANWSVDSSPRALRAFRTAVASPRYRGDAANVVRAAQPTEWGDVPGARAMSFNW